MNAKSFSSSQSSLRRRDDLLRENIQRLLWNIRRSNSPAEYCVTWHDASTSSSRLSGKSRSFGQTTTFMPRPTYPLQHVAMERVGPSWQTSSTEPISMPNSREAVATRLELAALQPIFRIQPHSRREAAVMRHHFILPKPLAQLMCHAFGHVAAYSQIRA